MDTPSRHFSRRKALRQLSLGAAGAWVAGSVGKELFARESPLRADQKLGVALVGLGTYSTMQLAPALQQTKFCKLTGIVTGTPAKADEWQKKYTLSKKNTYDYKTFDRIADNPDIDIVYVVLPNAMHAEYTIRALQVGKHVICEKPMALAVKDCQAMVEAAKKANRMLSVGYRLYFEPHHLEARRLGTEKVLGKVKMVEASLGFSMANPQSWRLNKALGGGGALVDLGLYAMQGARRIIGEEPSSVTAQGFVRDSKVFKDIYEMVFWQAEYPGGALSTHSTTYTSYVDRMYATAEQGWISLLPAFNATGAKGETSQGPMKFSPPAYQQIRQMDDFARCIQEKKPSAVSGEEAIKDIRIIESIFRALETGTKVKVA